MNRKTAGYILLVMLVTSCAAAARKNLTPVSPLQSGIAFVSRMDGQPDLWWMNGDSGAFERLTDDPQEERKPVWSPDGSMIAYIVEIGGDSIWLLDVSTLGTRRLTPDAYHGASSPTWSSDGHRLAYSTWESETMVTRLISLETGDVSKISDRTLKPVWAPAREKLAVLAPGAEWEEGALARLPVFLIIGLDGQPLNHLPDDWSWRRHVTGMDWSNAGDCLLVTSEAGLLVGDAIVEIVEVGEKVATIAANLTMKCDGKDCDFYAPSWFPNDKEILFIAASPSDLEYEDQNASGASSLHGRWWLYRANRELDSYQVVLESSVPIVDADLSPDGKKVAFQRGEDTAAEIWILDLETRQATQITDNDSYDGKPVWQPVAQTQ